MIFKFKQFEIVQEKSAMKIGTDGVLLGAWVKINQKPYSVLDIGTGTGLIALQIAQRSNAEVIDAIEIEANAFEEAVLNFENSKWNDRLYCYHTSLKEFTIEIDDKYDLIISNPPFYTESYQSNDGNRNKARFATSLPFTELLQAVQKLLSSDGVFSVIIPFKEEKEFLEDAKKNKLFPNRITRVKGTATSEIKRSLIEFSFFKNKTVINELIIEIQRHQYTKEYKELVKHFYLKM